MDAKEALQLTYIHLARTILYHMIVILALLVTLVQGLGAMWSLRLAVALAIVFTGYRLGAALVAMTIADIALGGQVEMNIDIETDEGGEDGRD